MSYFSRRWNIVLPWKIKSGDVLMIEQAAADEWTTQTTARDRRPEKTSETIWNKRCSNTSIKKLRSAYLSLNVAML